MKPLLRGLLCIVALVPVVALAVFDLTWVKRYNASQLVATRFDKSVSKPGGGGFYVAGLMGEDAFVAQFDLSGNLLVYKIFDSPLVNQQFGVDLWVDGSDVYLLALAYDGTYIVKYDSNLNKTLEIPIGNGGYLVDYNPTSDRFFVAPASFATEQSVRCLDTSGTQLWALPPSFTDISDIAFDPADGCFIGGRSSDNYEAIQRISATGTSVFYRKGSGTADYSRNIESLTVGSSSLAVGAGVTHNGTGTVGAIFTLTSGGTLSNKVISTASYDFVQISLRAGTTYRGILRPTSGLARVVEVDRTTGIVTRTFLPGSSSADGHATNYGAMPNSVLGIAHNPGTIGRTQTTWNSATGAYLSSYPGEETVLRHFGSVGSVTGITVGSHSPVTGLIRLFSSTTSLDLGYQLTGGPRRTLVGAVPLAGGAFALCFTASPGLQSYESKTTVVKYLANGSVAWARTVAIPEGDFFTANDVAAGPDGSVYLCGGGAAPRIIKLNGASGAQVYAKTFFDGEGTVHLDELAVDSTNQVYALGFVEYSTQQYRELIVKFDASGNPLTRSKIDSPNYQPRFEAMHVAPNGAIMAIATPWVLAVGTYNSFQVRQYNSSLGLAGSTTIEPSANSGKFGVRWAWDSQNDFIVAAAFGVPEVKIVRFPAGSVSATNFTTTLTGVSGVFGLASSPARDRIYLLDGAAPLSLRAIQTSNGATAWTTPLLASVTTPRDIAVDSTGNIYALGSETQGQTKNVYAAKYLTNGVRSAQRRLAGRPWSVHAPSGQGVRILGDVGTRNKGWGPFIARYD